LVFVDIFSAASTWLGSWRNPMERVVKMAVKILWKMS
jgi:hypothetical protein